MKSNFKILKNFTYFVPGGAQIAVLFFWFVVGGVIGNLLNLLLGKCLPGDVALSYGTLMSYPIMFIPPMMYAMSKSRKLSMSQSGVVVDNFNIRPLRPLPLVLMLAVGTLALGLIVEPVNSLLPEMPDWLEDTFNNIMEGNLLINFFCVAILAPFFEEWLCRGIVLRGMLFNKVKPVPAIITSAFLFAIIHLNPWQAIPAFTLGLLFGYVYYKTGSLKLTMWMHCVNNAFALIAGHYLPDYDSFKLLLGDYFWYAFAAAIIVLALVIIALRKIELSDSRGNMESVPSIFEQ